MLNIFNLQVTRRKGIAFYDLAGTPIVEGIKSPCEAVPNDLVVSVNSVNAIPLKSAQMPVLHTELTINQQVYNEFVLPKLQTPVGNFQYEPDSSLSGQPAPPIQFTRLYTGSLKPGEKNDLTIQIDAGVSVASFALYDASRSLEVKVTGASGKEIILSPEQNGLMKIEDPSILFYLGYGFNNPKAGAWVIHLATTNETPADGTEYALTANFTGGATLEAQAAPLIPKPGEPVTLSSKLTLDNQQLQISSAKASILQPNGQRVFVDLSPNEDGFKASWTPSQEGLHGIDLFVSGVDGTGQIVERTAFLAVQELPANPPTTISIIGLGLLLVLIIAMVIFIVYRRLRRRRMKTLVGG
jgi:hypothetical protein